MAAFVAAVVIAVLGATFWVGYQGTDDGSYVDAALAWYRHFPQVGHSHWDLRYPIVLALDAGFSIFGVNEMAVGVTMLSYLFAIVVVSIWVLQRWFGWAESLLFIAIFCAMPGIIVQSTIANAELPELFYVVVSVACYCAALESARARWLLVCAGISAGLAFATRETTLGLIAAYGLLFLLRPGVRRTEYFWIGLGFAAVILLEMTYFEFETGNPLWRYTLDVHHDVIDRSIVLKPGQVIDKEGNLGIGGLFAPIFVFLASQKYALVFYVMLGLVPLLVRASWDRSRRTFLITSGLLFAAWASFIIFNTSLLFLVPRYFVVTAWVAAMLAAIGLVRLGCDRPRLAGLVLAVLLMSDALCLYVENTDPNQPSRVAIGLALEHHEPVYTDTLTARHGRFTAQVAGVAEQIIADTPRPGSLYLLAPDNVSRCRDTGCAVPPDAADVKDWEEVAEFVPPPRAIGALLDRIGLTPRIPEQIRKKLIQPNSGVVVYRVPDAP